MLTLRTLTKDDFFETRIEQKPKPQITQLMQVVENLNQDIAECDQEIQRWQWKKHKIRNQFIHVVNKVKGML
jgi:hypothetical protein